MKTFIASKLFCLLLLFVPAPGGDGVPSLPEKTNWGNVSQKGEKVVLTGHFSWEAFGEFRKDKSLLLTWIHTDRRTGLGVYRLAKDDVWRGQWGWDEDAYLDFEGELAGDIRDDAILEVR